MPFGDGRTEYMKYLLIGLLFIGGCAPIGPQIGKNTWLCGDATAETTYADCVLDTSNQYYGYITSYSGSVYPVNYAEAVPHESGFIVVNGESIEATFWMGKLERIKWSNSENVSFDGKVRKDLSWEDGIYETPRFTFKGAFSGKMQPTKGVLTSKVSGDRFVGTVRNIGADTIPLKGVMERKRSDCIISSTGNFIRDGYQGKVVRDLRGKFELKNQVGKVAGVFGNSEIVSGSIELFGGFGGSFTFDSLDYKLKDGFINAVSSKQKVLVASQRDNGIYWSQVDWPSLDECNSVPNFKRASTFLDPVNKRSIVSDVYVPTNEKRKFKLSDAVTLTDDAEQLLLIKHADKQSKRKITKKFDEKSSYISGTRQVYNSDYDVIQASVYNAQSILAQERAKDDSRWANSPCTGSIFQCALADSLLSGTSEAEKVYENAVARLSRTPRMLTQNIYSDYEIEKISLKADKSATLVFALFDFKNGVTYRKKVPLKASKTFEVVSSPIQKTDTQKQKLLDGVSSEQEVDKWLDEEIYYYFDFEKVLVGLKTPENKLKLGKSNQMAYAQRLNKGHVAIKESTSAKSAIESARSGLVVPMIKSISNKTKAKPNVLEDSILVVERLSGMGTGFYVTASHVLTNQHVIEGSNYLDLRSFSGEKFSGRVIAKDIATDLALLQVNVKGVPLELHEDCNIRRRENVFTIGHPKGFEYSTSRGIVSAIRDMSQPFYPESGIKKRYIQIDASISPGNSGGPLFNSDEQVIGINTWGRTDGQNLNFAVHCSEIKSFLREQDL